MTAFELDEVRAREILIEHVTNELGVSVGEATTGTTLEDFNGYWNRAVDEVCQLVFFGDQSKPENVGKVGALRNADGYGVLVYPLDYEDSSDIIIALRREPIWSEPTSFIQVADISCETRKIVDGNEPGLEPLIEMCRNVVAEMNRLKPYLDKIGTP